MFASQVEIICIHPEYKSAVLGMEIEEFKFKTGMYYDHDIVEGSFGNIVLNDLTNYPQTIEPNVNNKATIHGRKELFKREIIGLRSSAQD